MTESRIFDQKAATWDEEPRRVALAKTIAEGILNSIPLTREMDLLDFGCGTGLLTLNLQPYVRSITGMDTSAGMLQKLEEKVTHYELKNVKICCCDFSKGERLESRFHMIVSAMALHHIADIPSLISIFSGLILPGGMICLADLDKEDGTFHDDPAGVHHFGFDRTLFKENLTANGFVVYHETIVSVIRKGTDDSARDYPVFLICARNSEK